MNKSGHVVEGQGQLTNICNLNNLEEALNIKDEEIKRELM